MVTIDLLEKNSNTCKNAEALDTGEVLSCFYRGQERCLKMRAEVLERSLRGLERSGEVL